MAEVTLSHLTAPRTSPPASPTVGQRWLSTSLADMRIDPSADGRSRILYSTRWFQEASVWYYDGTYHMIHTVDVHLEYSSCDGDPLDPDAWTNGPTVIGTAPDAPDGSGGWDGGASRSCILREGDTLYCYFIDKRAGNAVDVRVATAHVDTPTVWTTSETVQFTPPASAGESGNVFVIEHDGTYYMFLEYLHIDTFQEGTLGSFQTGVATSDSPTGPWNELHEVLTSPRVNGGHSTVSGCWIGREGDQWVMYYHARTWPRSHPSDIYRATTDDLAADSWVVDNLGWPIVRRAHPAEYDQVADPWLFQSPEGAWYMVWEGCNNRKNRGSIMCAALQPVPHHWDGARWVPDLAGFSTRQHGPAVEMNTAVEVAAPLGATRVTGTWSADAPDGAIGGRFYNTSAADNDAAEWDVTLPPGEWDLTLMHGVGPDNGVIHVDIDDGGDLYNMPEVGSVDTYAAVAAYNQTASMSFTIYGRETVRRRIRFRVEEPGAGGGYQIEVQGFRLQETSEGSPHTFNAT